MEEEEGGLAVGWGSAGEVETFDGRQSVGYRRRRRHRRRWGWDGAKYRAIDNGRAECPTDEGQCRTSFSRLVRYVGFGKVNLGSVRINLFGASARLTHIKNCIIYIFNLSNEIRIKKLSFFSQPQKGYEK